MRNWIAIGPADLLAMLVPLRDEHRRWGQAELLEVAPGDFAHYVRSVSAPHTTVVMVESVHVPSVRNEFRSPVVRTLHGRSVCTGWLRMSALQLRAYALRAVALHNRAGSERAVVLLAPREERYLQLMSEMEGIARNSREEQPVFRWSAERIRCAPMVRALRLGAAAVVFCGHGTQRGWMAYGGVVAETMAGVEPWADNETVGAMFSLSCRTGEAASVTDVSLERPRIIPFADAVVADGIAGAVCAPLGDPLHASNRVLACALMRGLCEPKAPCDMNVQWLLERATAHHASVEGYVVVGDPALPMRASAGAVERGRSVFAPAADAVLVPRGAAMPRADLD